MNFLNMRAPLVDLVSGMVRQPWNNWFQQFVQPPSGVMNVIVGTSPFTYQAKEPGTLVISGGTVSNITFKRGGVTINLGIVNSYLLMINDTIIVTFSVLPTLQFLPFYGGTNR